MVPVVVPLRHGGPGIAPVWQVALVLGDQVHWPRQARQPRCDVGDQVTAFGFGDLVNGIQAQPVYAEFGDPHRRIVDEVVAHRLLGKVDGRAPGRVPVRVEERGRDAVQHRPLGPEMIVDHIEDHHDPQIVRSLDERRQIVALAVGGVDRIG